MKNSTHTVSLRRHRMSRGGAAKAVEATVAQSERGALVVAYAVRGDLSRMEIPPPRATRRADRLWEHTCFEAFVAGVNDPAYYEFNFAPSTEWAVYFFERYRERCESHESDAPPRLTVRTGENRLEIEATIDLHSLAEIWPAPPLRVALAAVVEEKGGALSYWALKHPVGKPDFHHPDGFALEIGSAAPSPSLRGKPKS
jgi:hypothetical protein